MRKLLACLNSHYKLTSFLLGLLSVLALPPFAAMPLLFVTISGLFILIQTRLTKSESFWSGYWFGFGFFAAGFSWIGNALLIDTSSFGWLHPLVPLLSGAFFGLFIGLPSLLSHYFKGFYARFIAFPALWVLFEWIRSFIFTGFPWNLIGTTLSPCPQLLQASSLGGTYLLSLIVLYAAQSPSLWLLKRDYRHLGFSLLALSLALIPAFLYGSYRLAAYPSHSGNQYLIRLVQPSIPQTLKWDRASLERNFQQYIEMSRLPSEAPLSLVVWGETASPFPLDLDDEHRRQIQAAIPQNGYLLSGSLSYTVNDFGRYAPVNAMLMFDHAGTLQHKYYKSHLVPFGEYIPLRQYLPRAIRPITNVISDFYAGSGPQTFTTPNFPSLGIAICYEIIFPSQVINKHNPPQLLINLTNDGWYGKSSGPYQHFETTRLRAVEEGITVIRAANSGISALISPTGEVFGRLGLHQQGISDIWLPETLIIPSFYRNYGNIIPICLCLIFISISFILSFSLTRNSN